MALKHFDNITSAQKSAKGVVALSDNPNKGGTYGVGGLSASELKAWFDKLVNYVIDRLNTLQTALGNKDASGVGSDYIRVDCDGLFDSDPEGGYSLSDIVSSLTDGKMASFLKATWDLSTDEDDDVSITLQAILNDIAYQISTKGDATDLTALEGRMDDAEGDIDDLESDVADHTADIGDINTALGVVDGRLNAIESKDTGYDNHVGNSDIHVTASNKSAWTAKYDKPSGGIPKSDMASAVQTSLGKADTALQAADIVAKADLVDGKVPADQLPSYVDDVEEYASASAFPATGESGKIYVAKDTNKTYRWGGSGYVVISETLALGETSSTAYRGDRGKAAYDHSQVNSGNPHGVTKSDVGLGDVVNKGMDDTPTASSDKYVKSGGVHSAIASGVSEAKGYADTQVATKVAPTVIADAYDSTKAYKTGILLSYQGKLYECIKDATAGTLPTNTTYFKEVSVAEKLGDLQTGLENGTIVPNKSRATESIENVSDESGTTQDNPFISQGTGTNNNADSVDTSPVAKQIEKQGYTVANNQLMPALASGNGYAQYNFTTIITFSDGVATLTGSGNYGDIQNNNAKIYNGHKYLIAFEYYPTVDNLYVSYLNNTQIYAKTSGNTLNAWNKCELILTSAYDSRVLVRLGIDSKIRNWKEVDLTQYFNGNSNIPQDLLDNPSHWSWYDNGTGSYDAGSLKNASGRYLVCTKRNLLTYENENVGKALTSSGDLYNESSCNTSDYILIIPNRPIYLRSPETSGSRYCWTFYTKDKTALATYSNTNTYRTPPANAQYVRVTYLKTNKDKTCLSLYYSAEQGGEGYDQYYPYQEPSVYDTGTEELRATPNVKEAKLPNGKIAHTVAEISYNGSKVVLDGVEYTNLTNKAVMDIGGGAYVFYFDIPNMQGKYGVSNIRPSFNNFGLGNQNPFGNVDNFYLFGNSGDLRFAVAISGYTTTTEYDNLFASRPFVANVECFTGEEIQGTSFAENIEIDDYGMMYWLDTDGNLVDIPQGVKVFYPADYVLWLDTAVSTTNGDATDIALKSEITDTALAERGYNKTSDLFGTFGTKENAGGILRQMVSLHKSVDFNNVAWVDLGSLTWTTGSSYFVCSNFPVNRKRSSYGTVINALCSKYKIGISYGSDDSGSFTDKTIHPNYASSDYIYLKDTSYTNATALKNSLKGILMAYEIITE